MKNCIKVNKHSGVATISYDLSDEEQVYAYKCAVMGLDACLLLESMKAYTEASVCNNVPYLALLADIKKDLNSWENIE